ncbi:MAG: hypothetical protein ACJ8FY_27700 [Gemmataceae bacterium]
MDIVTIVVGLLAALGLAGAVVKSRLLPSGWCAMVVALIPLAGIGLALVYC